jgi:autotransporter-associated beta strand protein
MVRRVADGALVMRIAQVAPGDFPRQPVQVCAAHRRIERDVRLDRLIVPANAPTQTRRLTKIGAGTLTLSGGAANTYSGATMVSAGTSVSMTASLVASARTYGARRSTWMETCGSSAQRRR